MHSYNDYVLAKFKQRGFTVRELEDGNFEFVHESLPAKTHVYANDYFIQLTTFVYAIPRGFLGRFKVSRDSFLNRANQKTNLMKLTCSEVKFDDAWAIQCQIKITSGEVKFLYSDDSIANLVKLWLQDLAGILMMSEDFDISAMLTKNANQESDL